MAEEAKVLRIVVASPGELETERKLVPLVVDEVNRGVAGERGLCSKSPWETDAYPGLHVVGPQALIDAILRIPECDIFVGIVLGSASAAPSGRQDRNTSMGTRRAY